MDDQEKRIVQLEETIAHHARTIDELSAQIAKQWDAHERERKRLEALIERHLALEEAATPQAEAARPPHY